MEQVLDASLSVVAQLVSIAGMEIAMVAGATAGYFLCQGGLILLPRSGKKVVEEEYEPQSEPNGVTHELHSKLVSSAIHRLWQLMNFCVQAIIDSMDVFFHACQRPVSSTDSSWVTNFVASAGTSHHADVFEGAACLLAGMQSEAVDRVQVGLFAETVLAQLRCFDADCDKSRESALKVVEHAEARAAFLPAGSAGEMRAAFAASVERARAAQTERRVRPDSGGVKRRGAPPQILGQRAGQSLALTALAALGAHHQGLDTAAARHSMEHLVA